MIDHALVFTHDDNRAGGPVAPATESDGRNSELLPEGTYINLDNIPLDRFRVLEMGPQDPNPDLGIENSGVGTFGGVYE